MMELLVNAECGVIKYNTACQELGKSVVHSLIQYNLVHMCPTSRLSFDVPSHNKPIITAESPAALMAMRKLLMDEK